MDDVNDNVNDDVTTVLPTLQVSAADRLRVFREDDAALAELAEITHERAMEDGEHANASGHLDLRIRERRAAMWGYDSPTRFDMVQIEAQKQPSSHERIRAAILRVVEQEHPERRAAIRRMDELGPERVLELLGPPQPRDGNDDVDVLSGRGEAAKPS